jgi:thiamine biosynthesis lipoprotein
MARAFEWFHDVERRCSRFDPQSELRVMCAQTGTPVAASELLFSAVQFALAVAEDTDGAFDPTIGAEMARRGFDRHYVTGTRSRASAVPAGAAWQDVQLDPDARTITLHRPLVLDLAAVVKGLAIDLAAKELAPFRHFAIDAGGDLYVSGHNSRREPWSVGIRHPRRDREAIERLTLTDTAICTSGDYERTGEDGHHLIDPRVQSPAGAVASATVVAPTAMLADAFATAAFVLGPNAGIALLERHGVQGVLYSPSLDRVTTRVTTRGLSAALLPHA